MQRSAEYRAITNQTYAAAGSRLVELAPAISGTAWGVILDADETVLDNSAYAMRRARVDSGYTEESWSAWVRDTAATAVPGAVEFTRRVHGLGGRVVIVTNRADSLCALTRVNLRRVGVDADLVLCQPGAQTDKNPRFEAVERGTASPTLPALVVVEWIGDNIQDFPHRTQSVRDDPGAWALFGTRYFALPNPVYGSWEANPPP
jgi:5'-nucleotidase (lipoprotein e(P4) family)